MSDKYSAGSAMWRFRGQDRPAFAIEPGPGQESVWDYPRPPELVADRRRVTVRLGEQSIADTSAAYRILETASAPTFYLPPEDVDREKLEAVGELSVCEWKGRAFYWNVRAGGRVAERAAWAYPDADDRFAAIAGYLAFYAQSLDCFVDGEHARPQPGGFYGGWVTDELVGPFKGEPGTGGW